MTATKIHWTDHSLNPGIYGCSPAHTGCRNCYAAKMARRLAGMGQKQYEGLTTTEMVREDDRTMREVVRWTGEVRVDFTQTDRAFAKLPKRKPSRVFCTSMGDLFGPKVPYLMAEGVLRRFEARPHLTGQILTKHPGRMATFAEGRSQWPSNVMAGCSISDQATADKLIPDLLRVPAAVRFLSVEPMVGPVDLKSALRGLISCDCRRMIDPSMSGCPWCGTTWRFGTERLEKMRDIDWVIVGCESGPNRRPMQLEWARSVVQQCEDAGTACFVKQIHLDGRLSSDPEEWPEDLRVREFPR